MNNRERDDNLDLLAINNILRGNTEAYSEIVHRYQQYIYHLSLSFLGNRNDAEDAVQEIFLKTYRSLNTFSISRRFKPWIYSIAINQLKSCYRSNKRRVAIGRIELNQDLPDYPDPEKLTELNSIRETVRRAIQRLPVNLKEVTILYYLEELKIAEIGEILGIGRENVKSRLDRSRKKLRAFLS